MPSKSSAPQREAQRLELWRRAGQVWTDDLLLRDPEFLDDAKQAEEADASETLACISSLTFRTLLNVHYMRQRKVDKYLYTIMAHEIGHHAVAPAGFTNQMRLVAAATRASDNQVAPMYVNLALDLLINDVLVRDHELPCDEIYRALDRTSSGQTTGPFAVMLGAMEKLWGGKPLFRRRSEPFPGFDKLADALVATYELHGEGRRGADLLPFVTHAALVFEQARRSSGASNDQMQSSWDRMVLGGKEEGEALRRWLKTGGMVSIDAAIEQAERAMRRDNREPPQRGWYSADYGPKVLGEMFNGTGSGLPVRMTELVIAHYEAMANAHLVEFLADKGGHSEGYPESLRRWAWGEPLEEIDWVQTAIREGQPIPGVNTVTWEYGHEPEPIGSEPFPVDLDLYIDTSGSMPDPCQRMSHIALGAFIFALSVMRQGGAVRVTIWSYDMDKLRSTQEFSQDRDTVLEALCYSIQGGTQFPVAQWEKAIDAHKNRYNKVHTVILSDDGISTWFNGRYKRERVEAFLARVQQEFGAGGTVLLNGRAESMRYELPENWVVRGCSNWHEVVHACAEIASRRFAVD